MTCRLRICIDNLHQKSFESGMLTAYPDISSYAIRLLLPFASTCLCECGLSSLLNIKSKQRNCLKAVESDLLCALSNTTPNIENLFMINVFKSQEADLQ